MSELELMLEEQKKILKEDKFCYHTNLMKDGVFVELLRNGIEEEFFKELLSKYNEGYDFEIIFYDEINKKEIDKEFVAHEKVAEKMAEQSTNNSKEAYLKITEEAFYEGFGVILKNNKEVEELLLSKANSEKKTKKRKYRQ